MKKKYFMSCVILSFLLLLVLSGTTFAVWSQGEFEYKIKQVMNVASDYSSTDYSTFINNFLSSSAYNQYKDTIPFDDYEYLFFGVDTSFNIRLRMTNTTTSFYVNNSSAIINNSNFNCYSLKFSGNKSFEWTFLSEDYNESWTANSVLGYTYPNITGSQYFICCFLNNMTNQYNKTIYGANMTAYTPVYNGSTNVDRGEYYKLSTGFIGSYYYDNNNYENLEYKIISNTSEEFIGLKNIYYSPDINGQKVDIYIYVDPSMNQKGYKVVTYYNEEVLYQENAYNTLIVAGGGSSGDSGGGSVDLTETNNLISGVAATIRSGDEKIVNTIKSGDNAIISAIRSGDAAIIGFIGNDSDIDNMLDDLCSSGDTLQSLADEWGYVPFANPWATLIYEFFDAILTTLQVRQNVSWTFNFGGQNFTINSSEFDMLPSGLKVFVSGYLIFACIFVLYNSLRKTVDLLSTANTKEVLNTVEVDMNYILM